MRSRVTILLLVTMLCLSMSGLALAAPATLWEKTYDFAGTDWGLKMDITNDDGYILVGFTTSFGRGEDVWLVRTDSHGDTLWTRAYGGTADDRGIYVTATSDSGFLIVGHTESFGASGEDVYIIKTDAYGAPVWTRRFGGSADDIGYGGVETASGYVVVAMSKSYGGADDDIWALWLTEAGDTTYTRIYGGDNDDDHPVIQKTYPDSGFIILARTDCWGSGYDAWLVKTDAYGDTLWTHAYGGANYEHPHGVQQTFDGGYIIVSDTESYSSGSRDIWLVKTDSLGDTLWTRSYGGGSEDLGTWVEQTSDSGYIVTGITVSFGPGGRDAWLLKTDANGDTTWTLTFGDTGADEFSSVKVSPGGAYVALGRTNSFGTSDYSYYLVKTCPCCGPYVVSPGGAGEFPSIQDAINCASVGDTVLMAAGTYYEHDIQMKNGITLRSIEGPESTVIDADSLGRVIRCIQVDSPSLLEGITFSRGLEDDGAGVHCSSSSVGFKDCYFVENCGNHWGGGVYISGSTPYFDSCRFFGNVANGGSGRGGAVWGDMTNASFTNCVFDSNSSTEWGGAIYITDSSSPDIYDCVFSRNSAGLRGGGLYFQETGTPDIRRTDWVENSAGGRGGAIYNRGSAPTLDSCYFFSNNADTCGGAMACTPGATSSVTNCAFLSNSATEDGGAVYCLYSDPDFSNCRFDSNSTDDDGGAVFCSGLSTPTFRYCSFIDNSAGDGLANDGGALAFENDADPTITSCTFVGNSAGCVNCGSALHLLNSNAIMDSTIIAFGDSGQATSCDGDGSIDASCCDVFGNPHGDWGDCLSGQEGMNGNFSADPLFCGALSSNPHMLSACSPCAPENSGGCGLVGAYGVGCQEGPILRVPDEFPTIQAALACAGSGDTVLVGPGTYTEACQVTTHGPSMLILKSGVTLLSEAGSGVTILDAGYTCRVVFGSGLGLGTKIEGFTLTGGNSAGTGVPGSGGGLLCVSSSLEVENCHFLSNLANDDGGAAHCDSSSVVFISCDFDSNTASDDAGALSSWTSAVALEYCAFTGNTALEDGGAMKSSGKDTTWLTGCTFAGNDAADYGGGFYCSWNVSAVLTGCMFTGNSADPGNPTSGFGGGLFACDTSSVHMTQCDFATNNAYNGGGVYLADRSSGTLSHCSFTENTVASNGAGFYANDALAHLMACEFMGNSSNDYGGGICLFNAEMVADTCVITGNAAAKGGGVWSKGSGFSPTATTIAGNIATSDGGGIWANTLSDTLVTSVIWGNCADGSGDQVYMDATGCVITFQCCDIDSAGIQGSGTLVWGTGSLFTDPRFCGAEPCDSAPTLQGDYSLLSCSPCLDAPGCGLIGAFGQGCITPGTWYVLPDSTGDAPTIQAAIDGACPGDTILLACGTFYEHDIEIPASKSGITVTSEGGEPDCVTIDAEGQGRVFYAEDLDSTSVISGLTITGGLATGGDWTTGYGGGILLVNQGPAGSMACQVKDCVFFGNEAGWGGAIACVGGGHPTIENCVMFDNSAISEAGAIMVSQPNTSPLIDRCTIVSNSNPVAAVYVWDDASPQIERSIIAFNTGGPGVDCGAPASGYVTVACSDVYANEGGDWVGCLAAYEDVGGNISQDPLFCDAANTDFRLSSNSPCLYGDCGRVGAYDQGCFDQVPRILSILDVGNDQGRQVRVRWMRSLYDALGDTVDITGYALYRRQDEYMSHSPGGDAQGEMVEPLLRSALMDGWDYVATIPPRGDSIYQYIASTLCDSTYEGICWSTFLVSALTPEPLLYYDSRPDSGYSIDNLAPGVPQGFTGDGLGGQVVVCWDPNTEEDLQYYKIYRGADSDFEISEALAEYDTADTSYIVSDVDSCTVYYYRVAALDFSGNESDPTESLPLCAVGASVGPVTETPRLSLLAAKPNPFSRETRIAYVVPSTGRATLSIYDVRGRLVVILADDVVEAGRHVASWDGMDSRGESVPAGVYFSRLDAEGRTALDKVTLVR